MLLEQASGPSSPSHVTKRIKRDPFVLPDRRDMLHVIPRRHLPTYSVLTRRCSLQPRRFRWLLISSDNAHKIHAPFSYETEDEALEIGQAEATNLGGSRRDA